jgi:PqqD family protein of HPr-rel-A system
MNATQPKHVDGLEIRTVGAEVLVHDPAQAKVHVLNPTAGAILELCDGTRSPQAIAGEIARAYGADPARVEGDLVNVLGDFERLKLLLG